MTRVLVCGGRDYADIAHLDHVMTGFDLLTPIEELCHGDAPGADTAAGLWAESRGNITVHKFPADFWKYGKGAGPIRNKQMLDEFKPHVVIAFPGGLGTENMVAQAEIAGVRVIRA